VKIPAGVLGAQLKSGDRTAFVGFSGLLWMSRQDLQSRGLADLHPDLLPVGTSEDAGLNADRGMDCAIRLDTCEDHPQDEGSQASVRNSGGGFMPLGLVWIGGVLVALFGVLASAFMRQHETTGVPHIR
jgi:hypothetical protein